MEDYLHITLTDEDDVPEAMARLRVIYPNLMKLTSPWIARGAGAVVFASSLINLLSGKEGQVPG